MRNLVLLAALMTAILPTLPLAGQVEDSVPDEPTKPEGSATKPDDKPKTSLLNLPIKTAGGTQFWTDRVWRDGYRIQQNSLTGHFRLVDAKDVRRAWGTRTQCTAALDQLMPRPQGAAPAKHVVILLHGLMRTHHSMKPLEQSLKAAGYQDVIRFAYASTRSSVSDHAAALREVMEDFPADTQFSFVGHSMGNIVVRHAIGDLKRDHDPKKILPRCRSMAMLGPPNQGAAIARRLAPTGLYQLVTGKGGMELGPEWDKFVENLETPSFPFVIIAGDVSDNTVQNPLLDGSGDFVVSLDEARLEGSEAFHTVPVLHSFLMSDEAAMKLTVDFLQSHK